jgi:IrrE N-terminal-like domain
MSPHPYGRRWNHKSVRALVRTAGGGDPEEIIRLKSRELVAEAKAAGWSGPPFDPLQLASFRGITSRESTALFSAEAQLTPMEGNQLLLEFNPTRSSGRRNFSISHEIVHTLFEDCYEMVHQRKSNPKAFDPQQEVEHLCQVGAAEILMPYENFAADATKLPLSLGSVPELAKQYRASREAAARRLLRISGQTGALVFFSRRLKPREIRSGEPAEPKMRILYVVPSGDFGVFLPPHKSVPDHSCVCKVDLPDETVAAREKWDIPRFGNWFIEAMALPIPDGTDDPDCPSAVALVLPNR